MRLGLLSLALGYLSLLPSSFGASLAEGQMNSYLDEAQICVGTRNNRAYFTIYGEKNEHGLKSFSDAPIAEFGTAPDDILVQHFVALTKNSNATKSVSYIEGSSAKCALVFHVSYNADSKMEAKFAFDERKDSKSTKVKTIAELWNSPKGTLGASVLKELKMSKDEIAKVKKAVEKNPLFLSIRNKKVCSFPADALVENTCFSGQYGTIRCSQNSNIGPIDIFCELGDNDSCDSININLCRGSDTDVTKKYRGILQATMSAVNGEPNLPEDSNEGKLMTPSLQGK